MSVSRGIIDLVNEIQKETRDGKLLKIVVSPHVLNTIRYENKDCMMYSHSNESENLKNMFYGVEIDTIDFTLTDLKAKYQKAVNALKTYHLESCDRFDNTRICIACKTLAELGEKE